MTCLTDGLYIIDGKTKETSYQMYFFLEISRLLVAIRKLYLRMLSGK